MHLLLELYELICATCYNILSVADSLSLMIVREHLNTGFFCAKLLASLLVCHTLLECSLYEYNTLLKMITLVSRESRLAYNGK